MLRILDIIFATLGLILLIPLFIIIIMILSFTGENKIFFTQERVGKNKKKFKLIKFVTMLENSPKMENGTLTVKNDSRILPFGKFLRKTKINELTQIINILLGHMSFVGPRPLSIEAFKAYSLNGQKIITTVKPGLSGIGSIIFRNEEEIISNKKNPRKYYNKVISPYKEKLEIWYSKNNNLKVYIFVIILTVWVVILPKSNIIYSVFKNLPPLPDELT